MSTQRKDLNEILLFLDSRFKPSGKSITPNQREAARLYQLVKAAEEMEEGEEKDAAIDMAFDFFIREKSHSLRASIILALVLDEKPEQQKVVETMFSWVSNHKAGKAKHTNRLRKEILLGTISKCAVLLNNSTEGNESLFTRMPWLSC